MRGGKGFGVSRVPVSVPAKAKGLAKVCPKPKPLNSKPLNPKPPNP